MPKKSTPDLVNLFDNLIRNLCDFTTVICTSCHNSEINPF